MDVRVWLNKTLHLKVDKRVERYTTAGELKEQLARDGIMQKVDPQNILLVAPRRNRALRDSEQLTEGMDLELHQVTSPQAGKRPSPPAASSMVGKWLYDGKYQYRILAGLGGGLVYCETLSSGKRISGALAWKAGQAGGWFEVELRSTADGSAVGTMSLSATRPGELTSRFKSASRRSWGPEMLARPLAPVEWTPEAQQVEWFEVACSGAAVRGAPSEDAASCGWLEEGTRVQVRAGHGVDASGREWLELTSAELRGRQVATGGGSAEASADAAARGFALLGLPGGAAGQPPLLRGPLAEGERPASPPPAQAELEAARAAGLPFLPALPEEVLRLARGFVRQGWAHVERLGIAHEALEAVQAEVSRLDAEMVPGQRKGDTYSFRTDRRVFFDTSSERRREDIPALNWLVDTLQGFASVLGSQLARSPMRLRLQGRCRPMLAIYESHGHYVPHVDNGDGDGRVLTLVYYLNPCWTDDDGGHLRLYPEAERRALSQGIGDDECVVEVPPREDGLALFRADRMVHEVRPAERRRVALTLWFTGECDGV